MADNPTEDLFETKCSEGKAVQGETAAVHDAPAPAKSCPMAANLYNSAVPIPRRDACSGSGSFVARNRP